MARGPRAGRKTALLIPPIIPISICDNNPTLLSCNPGLGASWNLVSDTDMPSLPSCLEPFTVFNPGLTGPTITSHVQFVSTTADVQQSMDISGRVSGGLPGEIPVSGSIFGDASRTAKATGSTLTLMAYTKIEFAPRTMNETPKVSAAALERFDDVAHGGGPVAFRNLCGDRFVESVTRGAEYLAVIQMSSVSTSTQSHLKAALSAALGGSQDPGAAVGTALAVTNAPASAQLGASGSVSGSFEGTSVEVRIDVLQRGGKVKTNPLTPQDIINRFVAFPTLVTREADIVPMGVGLQRYTSVPNFGTRAPFSVSGATGALAQVLGPAYAAYFNAYNELSFALAHDGSDTFFAFDPVAAANMLDDAAAKMVIIEEEIDRCAQGQVSPACNVTNERALIGTDYATLHSRLPVRKQFYKITGKTFMDAAALKGAISTKAADGWTTGGSCNIDTDAAKAAAGFPDNVRVWTAGGIGGSGCRYKLFNRGRLTGLWDVQALNFDFSDGGTLVHLPAKGDLTLELTQFSFPWHSSRGWAFDITLVGPQGDETVQPWRDSLTTW
jgi:hypothetical protein